MATVLVHANIFWADTYVELEGALEGFMGCPLCGSDEPEVVNTHTACYTVSCQNPLCGAEVMGRSHTKLFRTKKSSLAANATALADALRRWDCRGGVYQHDVGYYRRVLGCFLRALAGERS